MWWNDACSENDSWPRCDENDLTHVIRKIPEIIPPSWSQFLNLLINRRVKNPFDRFRFIRIQWLDLCKKMPARHHVSSNWSRRSITITVFLVWLNLQFCVNFRIWSRIIFKHANVRIERAEPSCCSGAVQRRRKGGAEERKKRSKGARSKTVSQCGPIGAEFWTHGPHTPRKSEPDLQTSMAT